MNVRAIGIVGVLAVALGAAAAPASVAATSVHHATHHRSVVVTPADRAATHAYLIAIEHSDEAQLANIGQSTAAVEALAGGISRECTGVLAGSPPEDEDEPGLFRPTSQTQRSARAQGENNRQSRQRQSLKAELSFALDNVVTQSNHEALAAFVGELSPLKWSNRRITSVVHLIATILQEELALASPPVCADIRAWVASGYKTLAPASKEFQRHTAVLILRAFQLLALALSGDVNKPLDQLLTPYESAADRTLARRDETLTAQLDNEQKFSDTTLRRLQATVGLPATEVKPPIERPTRKPVVVDRGRTTAGTRTKHRRKGFTIAPLAHGHIPQGGPTFAIFGEHYRELGHAHFELQVGSDESFGGGHPGHFAAGVEDSNGPDEDFQRLFAPQTSTGCTPQPYAIVYGLLKAPRDKVFARVSGQLVPLRIVAIPARMHAHGALAYGAFSPIPTELVVTDTHGRTVARDDLSKPASATTETCEGEAEG